MGQGTYEFEFVFKLEFKSSCKRVQANIMFTELNFSQAYTSKSTVLESLKN